MRSMASPRKTAKPNHTGRIAGTAILILAVGGSAAAAPPGPFSSLEWSAGVTTDRSGYAAWITVDSTRHTARLPGHFQDPVHEPEHALGLSVSCRAGGGGLPERFPPHAPIGELFIQNHPDHPGTYTVAHPMHWILELQGATEHRFPVTVTIGEHATFAGTLVRPRTDYSAPHPGEYVPLPGTHIAATIAQGTPIALTVQGDNTAIEAIFTPTAHQQHAARMVLEHCPLADPEA